MVIYDLALATKTTMEKPNYRNYQLVYKQQGLFTKMKKNIKTKKDLNKQIIQKAKKDCLGIFEHSRKSRKEPSIKRERKEEKLKN